MKIICVGRNYSNHAKELNNDIPKEPVLFLKPDTAILRPGEDFYIPEFSDNLQHEVELLLKICKTGKYIQPEFAENYYSEIGLGIDFTARDLQDKLKDKGLPWEISKAFDHSALIGDFVTKDKVNLDNVNFSLLKNGNIQQQGKSSDMLFPFNTLVSYISQFFTLKTGDIIFTGTPSGVSAVKENDILEGFIENEKFFEIAIR
ncbi:fumarylacetoacetate hydrolase family protein [Apibacter sp. HY039]|uniref:fumarylacetoacetate hydrolase family protein n=1 Tax=Apibacter sp. HY039 TaxID=2501476 RepID=UPI000FEB88C5|nr:fumarylacetoacetate hydrolase family protein [Apibacter sp. HY039]